MECEPKEIDWDSEEEKWDPEEMDPEEMYPDGWYHVPTELEKTLNDTQSEVLSGHVVLGGIRGEKRPDDGMEVRLQMEVIPFDTSLLLEDILSGADLKPTSEIQPISERQPNSGLDYLEDIDCRLFLGLILVMLLLVIVVFIGVGRYNQTSDFFSRTNDKRKI
ncbi:unnamed protein product [Orchesella dallaii]|uniref:WH2 domain-containing protein n=1 Tax=Orchesella dallaii TaxID=48710 RepID=A0ABP1PYX2_9HEXA